MMPKDHVCWYQDSTVEWIFSIILDEFKGDLNESSHPMAMYESPKHRI